MKILKPIEQQKLRGRHNSNIKEGVGIITALSSGMPTSLFYYFMAADLPQESAQNT